MEQTRSMKIARLEVAISLLRQRDKRMRALISSTLTAPKVRSSAQLELESILREKHEAVEKLAKAEQGQ